MEQNKQKKSSKKYIIIGVIIVIVGIVGALFWFNTEQENKEAFNSNINVYNRYFEEQLNYDNYRTFTMAGDYGKKEVTITLEEKNLEYDLVFGNGEKYDVIDKERCDEIINPIIEGMNEKGWDNLHYVFSIVDKNGKELTRFEY